MMMVVVIWWMRWWDQRQLAKLAWNEFLNWKMKRREKVSSWNWDELLTKVPSISFHFSKRMRLYNTGWIFFYLLVHHIFCAGKNKVQFLCTAFNFCRYQNFSTAAVTGGANLSLSFVEEQFILLDKMCLSQNSSTKTEAKLIREYSEEQQWGSFCWCKHNLR